MYCFNLFSEKFLIFQELSNTLYAINLSFRDYIKIIELDKISNSYMQATESVVNQKTLFDLISFH